MSPAVSIVRRTMLPSALCGALTLMGAADARAQERLLGDHSIGAAALFETISFGGAGLLQSNFAGLDTSRITRVQQFGLPVTAASPLGGGWRVDVTTLFAHGTVTYTDPKASGGTRTAALNGLSDLRLRASGRLLNDAVVMTIGVNAPTGRTALTTTQFSTLRILAAPGLGLGSSPVGAGPSGTVGVVYGAQAGPWGLAMGGSYEFRGSYQPVAALSAGAPSADFRPGGVIRASLGADRVIGPHRLSLAFAADVFSDDKLRNGASTTLRSATVRLGPVLSSDAQLQIAAPRFRDLIVYSAYRWRAPFARDGQTVTGSSGHYLEAGVRAALPISRNSDMVFATDGRLHSGLGVDQGLPTAGVKSGSATLGLNARLGLLSVQPYVRAQAGSLTQRAALLSTGAQSFAGVSSGLVVMTKF